MRHSKYVKLAAGILLLAPCAAQANGWTHVWASSNITLSGAVIGCLIGLAVAIRRRLHTGGLFAWTIGAGLVIGLGAAVLSIGGDAAFFFPNNAGFALAIVAGVVLLAAGGGALLALLGVAIRTVVRRFSDRDRAQHGK